MMGMPRNVLSNWLNGYFLPKLAQMRELTLRLPGLTLEWIYWGDDRLMPGRISPRTGYLSSRHSGRQLELW